MALIPTPTRWNASAGDQLELLELLESRESTEGEQAEMAEQGVLTPSNPTAPLE